MAEIVLGMWTTHGPTLSTTPEQWLLRLPADHANKQHPFRGGKYDFEKLVQMRKHEDLATKSSLAERTRRHAACRAAIDRMADIYEQAKPTVAVIFGNDQQELFLEKLMPAFTIFNGETIWNEPASPEQAKLHPPGIHAAEWGHKPSKYTEYPGHPELADELIGHLVADSFDITRANELPRNDHHWHSGIGHAFGFIYRQIMRDQVIANVPIIANTFFPPNQPTAKRCFELGRSVGRALREWESDDRIAIFGSGGMSHFVIDEAVDQAIFDAIAARDVEALISMPESTFQSGTSELKNWIAAAGVLFETELSGGVVDYVPCYRSEAGTGTANGFVAWT
jgi:Catalytic LigB subunit of aromatic ring-opening dioxygenase